MLFNSSVFLFYFLPAVIALVWLSGRVSSFAGRVVLALASLYFYSQGDSGHLVLLLVSTLTNFMLGARIQGLGSLGARKHWLMIGVALNLGCLALFKYLNFLSGVVADAVSMDALRTHVALPLGISFYTFTQIAYLVDSAGGDVKEKSIVDYALFVWYFPHQIAGPILHHKEMLSQFRSEAFGVDARKLLIGSCIIGLGLFKKVVIADWFERMASPIFAAAAQGVVPGFFESWVGALAYTLQIYFDFSAYCDMAVGISYLFGVRLPANFNSPYKSLSIIEFWRRWHLTLSRFLRDYLYIPLGGNRHGERRRQFNLLTTMVLGGFWHGASWNFLIWGALHGSYLVVNHYWSSSEMARRIPVPRVLAWALTMFFVVVAWVFFRAVDVGGAIAMLKGMSGDGELVWPEVLRNYLVWIDPDQFSTLWAGKLVRGFHVLTIFVGIAFCAFMPNLNQIFALDQPTIDGPAGGWRKNPLLSVPGVLLVGLIFGWALSRLGEDSAFIYFNF